MKLNALKALLLSVFLSLSPAALWAAEPPVILNQALQTELLAMGEKDQALRAEAHALIEKNSGQFSEDVMALLNKQAVLDQELLQRLEAIIAEYGWPGRSLVGVGGARAAFLILQHSEVSSQKKYLGLFRAAVAAGEADTVHLAMLEDRVLMYEGQKQLYGTQLYTTAESGGKLVLYPVQDEVHVDERRAAVGLPPLADYLKLFGIEYQPPGN